MIQLIFDADTPARRWRAARGGGLQPALERRARRLGRRQARAGGRDPPGRVPGRRVAGQLLLSELYLMRSHVGGRRLRRRPRPLGDGPPGRRGRADRRRLPRRLPLARVRRPLGRAAAPFFNGPTGPNEKTQWTKPITWSKESWRDESFPVPAGGAVSTSATDFFCAASRVGSEVLRQIKVHPARRADRVGGLAVLLLWALSRTDWTPGAPLRVARRRVWGQTMASSGRMMLRTSAHSSWASACSSCRSAS